MTVKCHLLRQSPQLLVHQLYAELLTMCADRREQASRQAQINSEMGARDVHTERS